MILILRQLIAVVKGFSATVFDSPGAAAATDDLIDLNLVTQTDLNTYDFGQISVNNIDGDTIGSFGSQFAGASVQTLNIDSTIA